MVTHMMGGISVKGTYENGDYFKCACTTYGHLSSKQSKEASESGFMAKITCPEYGRP